MARVGGFLSKLSLLVIRVLSRSTLRIRETYDEVWRPVSATFEIETFQEEQQTTIDVFFWRLRRLHFVTNWLWKIFNISSRARYRSPLFSTRNRSLHLLCRPLKLSWKTRCSISMVLRQEDCPPSTFGLFCERCCEANKLKLVVSCSDFFLLTRSPFIHTYNVAIF